MIIIDKTICPFTSPLNRFNNASIKHFTKEF